MGENFIPVPSATAGYNVRTQEIVASATTVQVHYMIPCNEAGTAVAAASPLPVDTELPAAAALADNTANPTVPGVAAYQMGMDESGTWDRARLSKIFDMDSGAGTENVVGVTLRKSASGGSVEYGTSTNPLYTAQTSLPLPSGAATSANQSTEIGHLESLVSGQTTQTETLVSVIEAFNAEDQTYPTRYVGIAAVDPSGLVGPINALVAGTTDSDGEGELLTDRALYTNSHLRGYNGTSWDRLRSSTDYGLEVEVKKTVGSTSEKQDELKAEVQALQDIANLIASAVRAIAEAKGISADLRMTLLSGVLTSCGTVSTVTSLTQFAGYSAVPHIWSQMNQAAVQSNINNVVIS